MTAPPKNVERNLAEVVYGPKRSGKSIATACLAIQLAVLKGDPHG